MITEINYAIRWIVIYPVDSAIRHLNNWGLFERWFESNKVLQSFFMIAIFYIKFLLFS